MKRDEMIGLIEAYYISINRIKTPKFREYSNHELEKCIYLFKLKK